MSPPPHQNVSAAIVSASSAHPAPAQIDRSYASSEPRSPGLCTHPLGPVRDSNAASPRMRRMCSSWLGMLITRPGAMLGIFSQEENEGRRTPRPLCYDEASGRDSFADAHRPPHKCGEPIPSTRPTNIPPLLPMRVSSRWKGKAHFRIANCHESSG